MFSKKTSLSLVVGLFISLIPQMSSAKDYNIGTVFSDTIQYDFPGAKLKVPLPPGNWTLITKIQTRTETSNITLVQSYFIRHDQKLVTGMMRIKVPKEVVDSHWGLSNSCSEKKKRRAWYVHDSSYEMHENCSILYSLRGFRRNSKNMRDLFGYIEEKNLVVPNTWVMSRFSRTDKDEYLRVDYALPQEHYGIPREQKYSNSKSPWSINNISSHPKKKAFMKKANAWAKSWKGLVDSGFKNKLRKEVVLAHPRIDGSINKVAKKATRAIKRSTSTGSDTETRLKKLQRLLDQRLITPDEYRDQRKKILNKL
jgi:hypothetical protein